MEETGPNTIRSSEGGQANPEVEEMVRPEREDEYRYAASGARDVLFGASLVFGALFLLLAHPARAWISRWPSLDSDAGFVLLALAAFALLVGILQAGKRHYMLWWEGMPHFLRCSLNWRAGVQGFDVLALLVCIAAVIAFGFLAPIYVPVAVASGIGFLALSITPIEKWPVRGRTTFRPPNAVPAPAPESGGGGFDLRDYVWRLPRPHRSDAEGRMRLSVRLSRYEEYRSRNPFQQWPNIPPHREVIDELVARGITDEVVQACAAFLRMTQNDNLSRYEELANVLAFVQGPIAYDLSAEQDRDYWRYPIETLEEQKGDCDCKAILAAALLLTLGHKVLVLVSPDHVAVAVAGAEGIPGEFYELDGDRYYFCETTQDGWRVGALPEGLSLGDFTPYRVERADHGTATSLTT